MRNLTELKAAEAAITNAGYEGVVLRRPDGPYAYGRVTVQSRLMLKHKRRIEAEGVIEGVEGAGIVEGFRVRHADFAKPFFVALTGPIAQRRELWAMRERLSGKRLVFTHYAGAWKGEPRAPQFKRLVD